MNSSAGEFLKQSLLRGVNPVVKITPHLEIGLVVGAAFVVISTVVVAYLKLCRKKDPAEIERLRRLGLGRTGRITAGEITGLIDPEGKSSSLQLVYRYDIAGVTYEVSQDVSAMPAVAAQAAHLMGRGVSVKYDVKHPTNSILVCETWSGISNINGGESEPDGALRTSADAAEKS